MSNKNKPQVINNIQNLNLDIDYDKLAEAIVKAEKKANDPEKKRETIGFFKAVWHIIANKKPTQKQYNAILMAIVISTIMNGLSLLSLAFFIIGIIYVISSLIQNNFTIIQFITTVLLDISFIPFGLAFRACANEMNEEKDKNYIVAVFSGFSSFAAVIVALVALLK